MTGSSHAAQSDHIGRRAPRLLALALFLALPAAYAPGAGLAPSSARAAAPPAISLSRTQGAPGSGVYVKGFHFGASVPVTITLAGAPVATGTTTLSGFFDLRVTVPPLKPGACTLSAMSAAGLSSGVTFVVTPRPRAYLHVLPRRAAPGAVVTISGGRFDAGEAVSITLPGGSTAVSATLRGTFSITAVVPAVAPGTYTIAARGAQSGQAAAADLRVVAPAAPRIVLSARSGAPGRVITVWGYHFGAGETVQLALASSVVATATTTAAGDFRGSFAVSPIPPAVITFAAIGESSGISATVAFRVTAPPAPSFGLSRRRAVAGEVVVAEGRHFGSSEVVNISMGNIATVATVTTTPGGAFKVSFAAPAVGLGSYTVTAIGMRSAISATFPLVVVAPPSPALVLWRHAGLASAVVPARGYHFGSDQLVGIAMNGSQVAAVTTNANGFFYARLIMPALPAGTYGVTARGANGVTASSFFTLEPAPYGSVTGVVGDDASSAPIPGAIVRAFEPSSNRYASTITDGSGAYHLRLRAGYWLLTALVRDGLHLRMPPTSVYVTAGSQVTQNLLVPRARALIEGSVYGPPATAITVTAYSSRDSSQVVVTTDGSGHAGYTLGATIGLWHVHATLPPASRDAFDAPHARAVAVTQVGSAVSPVVYATGTTLTFIPAPYTIVVTVKDSAGSPVTSGVRVAAYAPDFPNGGIGVATDLNTNGVYTMHVAGGAWRVDVDRVDGPSPVYQRLIVNPANPSVSLTFVLQAAPETISGIVYDADGQPLAGAVILARAYDGELVRSRGGVSGTYLLHVFPGAWSVLAFAPELGLVGRATVVVASGSNPVQDFAAPLTFRVGGTVRVGGTPLPFAHLRAYAQNGRNHAETDLDGTYSMLLPVGSYTLRGYAVQAGALGDEFFTVAGNIFDQDWNLPAQGAVRVTVQVGGRTIDDPTGTAANVSAWDPYTGYWNATSDNVAGAYTLPLLAGVYTVRVGVPGQGQLMQRNVQVTPNGTVDLNVAFGAYGTVQGTVDDTSGQPIMGAAVFLSRGRIHVRTITDARGFYVLHVQPGFTYNLGAQQPGYVLANAQRVFVAPSGVRTANLTMAPASDGASGEALVAGTAGAPAVYAWVWAIDHHGGYAQTRSDGFGGWRLRLAPGTWYVSARFDGFRTAAPVVVTVPPSGVAGVRLLLAPIAAYSPPLPAAATFLSSSGVDVASPDGAVEAQVPANAAGDSAGAYSIDVQETTAIPDAPNGVALGGRGVEIGVDDPAGNPVTQLSANMTLNLAYNPALLPAGVSGADLTVGYLDAATGTWQPLDGTVDTVSHTISVTTNQLGAFAILLPS